MHGRKRRLTVKTWSVLQAAIRKNDYKAISSRLDRIFNSDKCLETPIITELNETDKDVIESILSDIGELLDI